MRKVSGATGAFIPCSWWDCDRYGDDKYEHVHREGVRYVHYLFCTERHRELWRYSRESAGNLPVGSKGMIT